MTVEVKILFFAKARELTEKKDATAYLPKESTCREILGQIVTKFCLEPIADNIILAINEEYHTLDDTVHLNIGDSIAVIPPLSGG